MAISIKKRALTSLIWYSLDISFAITAWTIGFGLTVHNWAALILIGIFSRWIFHVIATARMRQTVEDEKAEEVNCNVSFRVQPTINDQ